MSFLRNTKLLMIILPFAVLLSACSEKVEKGINVSPKDLEKISKEIRKLSEERSVLTQELDKHISFSVIGEIIERGESRIAIFGTAVPSNGDWGHQGVLSKNGNIIIDKPKKENISPTHYSDSEVYYIGKTTGRNRFGAPVPVNLYTTDPPSEVVRIKKKILEISDKLNELTEKYKKMYAQLEQEKFNKAKNNPQELFRYAEECLAKGEKDTAIQAYKRILEIEPKNADAHVSLGKLSGSKEEFKIALSINPKHIEANKELGKILLNYRGISEDVVKEQLEYIRNAPDNSDSELKQKKHR